MRRSLVRIVRRLASVGWAVKTGRTARPSIASLSPAAPSDVGDLGDRTREPAVLGTALAQTADAVDLLGDVGQQEVGREGAHEGAGRVDGDFGQQLADAVATDRLAAVRAALLARLGQVADLLDESQ